MLLPIRLCFVGFEFVTLVKKFFHICNRLEWVDTRFPLNPFISSGAQSCAQRQTLFASLLNVSALIFIANYQLNPGHLITLHKRVYVYPLFGI